MWKISVPWTKVGKSMFQGSKISAAAGRGTHAMAQTILSQLRHFWLILPSRRAGSSFTGAVGRAGPKGCEPEMPGADGADERRK